MSAQVSTIGEEFWALRAPVRLVTRMYALVHSEVARGSKFFVADGADVRLLPRVSPLMYLHVPPLSEGPIAVAAFERFLAGVGPHVRC